MLTATSAHAADKLRLERLDLSKSPTLRLYLSYVDADGRVITGKTKDDFKFLLDSADQGPMTALTTFDQTQEPVNVVTVVEMSTAMKDALEDIQRGVRALAEAAGPKSKMALISYASEMKRLADLSAPADVGASAAALAIDAEGVEMRMLDAVRTAMDLLNATPKNERRLIVLFSDGIDISNDRKAFAALGKRAQEAGIIIDSIGYAPFEPMRLRTLGELSKVSTGSERTCKAASDISAQFANVADELRKQYIATFEVAFAGGDGKDHTFQVANESAGRYSNIINAQLPKATHAVASPASGGGLSWWAWALIVLGVIVLLLFVVWLLFREKEEPVVAQPVQPAPAPAAPARTMALDIGQGGKQLSVGWIVATSGKQATQTFKLKPARTLIGTGSDCDIVVDDKFMSSHHCEVQASGGNFKLIDLGSTNGIVVNDKKVREHELVDNDVFRLGRTEFKFKSIS